MTLDLAALQNIGADRQIALLFIILFGLLTVVSIVVGLRASWRGRPHKDLVVTPNTSINVTINIYLLPSKRRTTENSSRMLWTNG